MRKRKKSMICIGLCLILTGFIIEGIFLKNYKKESDKGSGQKKEISIDCGNGVMMDFIRIVPGTFYMGSEEEAGDDDETPKHEVTISKPFYIGKYEVTQAQWKQVMGELPCEYKGNDYPVDSVSWIDCQEFLSQLETITGYQFSLPTEAEWEYSCRAGSTTKWFFGDDSDLLLKYAWAGEEIESTKPVGQKDANPWGLYDIYGNVQEWCMDWYQDSYSVTDSIDPSGPESGISKVIRGGGWGENANMVRSAYRNANGEEVSNDGTGFRCVFLIEE